MTFETAVFDNSAKQMLEDLFGMSTGYVMDRTTGRTHLCRTSSLSASNV